MKEEPETPVKCTVMSLIKEEDVSLEREDPSSDEDDNSQVISSYIVVLQS